MEDELDDDVFKRVLGDLDETQGCAFFEEGSIVTLPLICVPGIILFPEQILPLRLKMTNLINQMKSCLDNERVFAFAPIRQEHPYNMHGNPALRSILAPVGTTAQIIGYSEDTSEAEQTRRDELISRSNYLGIKSKGQQRFRLLKSWVNLDNTLSAQVMILPDICDIEPLYYVRPTHLNRLYYSTYNYQKLYNQKLLNKIPSNINCEQGMLNSQKSIPNSLKRSHSNDDITNSFEDNNLASTCLTTNLQASNNSNPEMSTNTVVVVNDKDTCPLVYDPANSNSSEESASFHTPPCSEIIDNEVTQVVNEQTSLSLANSMPSFVESLISLNNRSLNANSRSQDNQTIDIDYDSIQPIEEDNTAEILTVDDDLMIGHNDQDSSTNGPQPYPELSQSRNVDTIVTTSSGAQVNNTRNDNHHENDLRAWMSFVTNYIDNTSDDPSIEQERDDRLNQERFDDNTEEMTEDPQRNTISEVRRRWLYNRLWSFLRRRARDRINSNIENSPLQDHHHRRSSVYDVASPPLVMRVNSLDAATNTEGNLNSNTPVPSLPTSNLASRRSLDSLALTDSNRTTNNLRVEDDVMDPEETLGNQLRHLLSARSGRRRRTGRGLRRVSDEISNFLHLLSSGIFESFPTMQAVDTLRRAPYHRNVNEDNSTSDTNILFSRFRRPRRNAVRRRRINSYTPRISQLENAEEIELSEPEQYFRERVSTVHHMGITMKPINNIASSMTHWPAFVYKQYDLDCLVGLLMREIFTKWKSLAKTAYDIPNDDPFKVFCWINKCVPIDYEPCLRLLTIDNIVTRLRAQLNILEKCKYFACKYCGTRIFGKEDVFNPPNRQAKSTFVNPSDKAYEFVTVNRIRNTRLDGDWSGDFTWFTGYSWSVLHCKDCHNFLGWAFHSDAKLVSAQVLSPATRRRERTSAYRNLRDNRSILDRIPLFLRRNYPTIEQINNSLASHDIVNNNGENNINNVDNNTQLDIILNNISNNNVNSIIEGNNNNNNTIGDNNNNNNNINNNGSDNCISTNNSDLCQNAPQPLHVTNEGQIIQSPNNNNLIHPNHEVLQTTNNENITTIKGEKKSETAAFTCSNPYHVPKNKRPKPPELFYAIIRTSMKTISYKHNLRARHGHILQQEYDGTSITNLEDLDMLFSDNSNTRTSARASPHARFSDDQSDGTEEGSSGTTTLEEASNYGIDDEYGIFQDEDRSQDHTPWRRMQ